MTKDEIDRFVEENMHEFKEEIDDIPNHYPFNLANDLSNQYRHCDIQKLYNAMNELSPKYKAALILRYKYKYTYKCISETLGYGSGCAMLIGRIRCKLRRYHDIYVYDKKYIASDIKEYEDEINSLKIETDKLNKNIDYLMDQVLKDNNINRINLISKMDNALKLMDISINDLNLSTRAYNALYGKYDNLYKLSNITIEELWKIRGLGTDTIKEIVDRLYYEGIYIDHKTIKNVKTGQVKYISKNDKTNYKIWKFI